MAPATDLLAPAGSTTAAGRAGARGPVLHPRLVAVVTAVCCAAHLWLAAAGRHGVWLSVLMLALAAICMPCAVHIWRHSRVGALHQVTAAAVAMAAVHAFLLLAAGGAGHAHAGAPPSSVAPADGAAELLLVIALELATALLAAALVARLRRVPV
ncbi:hypothetical protein [Arthrobacter sp. NicSoilB11]|uniref:hypothetical protein n=1 Tax=Arthrobacter sp. NicSoilB11 TaxID=2830999 RepID=UPI001CC7B226|nr:hypothetical protein [Arthrobacter sp. NicSoilB11]BCW77387.1 hypothetical protein NicSoilB11_37120 [Arthrobacter sp. NicSoilB11]